MENGVNKTRMVAKLEFRVYAEMAGMWRLQAWLMDSARHIIKRTVQSRCLASIDGCARGVIKRTVHPRFFS